MKLSLAPLIGLVVSSAVLAEEPESGALHFAPSVELVAGISPSLIPINRKTAFSADIHSTLGATLTGEPLIHAGANLGIFLSNWEVKPLGVHFHCHHGEPCEFTYSFESFGDINSDWALGVGFGIGRGGIHEIRLPISWRGFSVTPSINHEEGQWSPSVQITAVWKIHPQLSMGPSCQFSEEIINCGASFWLAHAHPH